MKARPEPKGGDIMNIRQPQRDQQLKLLSRLDEPFETPGDERAALRDALNEALNPLRALEKVLCQSVGPRHELAAVSAMLTAGIRDVDYVLKKGAL